ncbi:MAG: hypothetical protein HYU29_04370 [Chloroflexi bacterium]|nr:hypothetical protein [Chloroflexota bacterium]
MQKRRVRGSISIAMPGMKVHEFLARVPEAVRQSLPGELRGFQVNGPLRSLVKLHYDSKAGIHYEVWVQRRTGRVEVGLHFEGEPEANARNLMKLAQHFSEIRSALGPSAEAEQWTKSWTRIHETLSLEPLTEGYLKTVAERLALYLRVLQPILEKEEMNLWTA